MPPLAEFRENPDRCIYVTGQINQQLVDKLTPIINRIRLGSREPITVYIDSLGGLTSQARLIMDLLRTPTQDGSRCAIVTVATGTAASAAADLFVWGNYAIAYPHARIWFHGTRQQPGEQVTTELALSLAESLKQRNEGFALEMAKAALSRFFFRYLHLRTSFEEFRNNSPNMQDAELMALSILVRLSTEFRIPIEAMKKHGRLSELTRYLSQKEQRDKHPPKDEAHFQAKLLKRLIDFKVNETRNEKNWSFSKKGIGEVQQDFTLFLDYHAGDHMRNLREQVISWGPVCLDDAETEEYKNIPPESKEEWLVGKTQDKFKPLWQLLVSICRSLQQDEHIITAKDAYWLGLIDEVIGENLPNRRILMENRPTVQPPPAPDPESSTGATAGS
jgi:ATP-dependent protease ClpP protease subunit